MSFVTASFLLFFLIFLFLFYTLPNKFRWILVLLASYLFYAFEEPLFLGLLIISTVVDFFIAKRISSADSKLKKKIYLALSLSTNLGLLLSFKYLDFIKEIIFNGNNILAYKGFLEGAEYILPIGISFYTFQTLSYTIDVYRNQIEPEKHLGHFSVFVSYFPQLIAGPIERSRDLLPQIKNWATLKYFESNFQKGLSLIIWGVFKKVIIADRLAVVVDKVHSNYEAYSSLTLFLSGVLFMIQIYADFSGYTSIARGLAKLMGIDLSINWDYPLFKTSFKDFHTSWHITLSRWFKNYIYVPLGGNQLGFAKWTVVVLLIFFISGVWHGANLTFILWAMSNGIALILERYFHKKKILILPSYLKWLFILFFQTIIMMSFRSESTQDFINIMKQMWSFESFNIRKDFINLDLWFVSHIVNLSCLFFFFRIEWLMFKGKSEFKLLDKTWFIFLLILIIIIAGEFQNNQFIYFQF